MFRSTRFWAITLVAVFVASVVLSNTFTVDGNANDPFLAELGNIGMPLALLGLVLIAVRQAVRWARRRQSHDA